VLITEEKIKSMMEAQFKRLVEAPETRTKTDISTYIKDKTNEHTLDKIAIYQNNFANNGDVISEVSSKKTVLSMEYTKDAASNHVQTVKLTAHSDVQDSYAAQAITVDRLQELSKAMNAIEVNIASIKADGTIDAEGAIKGAFNALHAGLIPQFDQDTWLAVNNFIATLDPSKFLVNDEYTNKYRGKDFLQFLQSLQPNTAITTTPKTPIEIANGFTDVMKNLVYDEAHIQHRESTTKPKL
jgi:hypothetical protein